MLHSAGSEGHKPGCHDRVGRFHVGRRDFLRCFDGHGPLGHFVAHKVRDALPLKLLSFLHSYQSRQNGSSTACFKSDLKKLNGGDSEKDSSTEDKLDCLWREAFLKSYKAMGEELRSHPNLDCFCSGSAAVTIVRQGSNLFMGYIGDSRAILGPKDSSDFMVTIQLTVDLKPEPSGEVTVHVENVDGFKWLN